MALVEVEVGDDHGRLVARRLHELAPVRIADERGAVEAQRRLAADAVDRDHEYAVGDRVADDHLLPQRLRVELRMLGLGTDRGRVHEYVGSLQAVRARDLREPLIPAGRQAELRLLEGEQGERVRAARPGAEVAVLVIARGHRDVQLARARGQLAVGAHDDRGVVAEPVLAVGALVQRSVDVRARLARHARGEAMGGAAGEILGLDAGRPRARRIDREVGAERELLQAHEPRARARGEPDPRRQRRLVLLRVRMPALLHRADPQRRSARRALARRRGGRGGCDDQADLAHRR